MARAAAARLARAANAFSKPLDGVVLRALRAEIDHELSSGPPQPPRAPMARAFAVEWDDAKSRDVVLRKRRGEGEEEEVVVSALLGPVVQEGEGVLPGNVFAKVCVGKARGEADGLILQFDCEVRERGGRGSDLVVRRVSHVCSSGDGPLSPPSPRIGGKNDGDSRHLWQEVFVFVVFCGWGLRERWSPVALRSSRLVVMVFPETLVFHVHVKQLPGSYTSEG